MVAPANIQQTSAASTAIGTAETTLVTHNSTHASGVKIVIVVIVDIQNTTGAGVVNILAGNLKLKQGATVLDDNNQGIKTGNALNHKDLNGCVLLASRTTAAANEVFTVTGLADATGENAQVTITTFEVTDVQEIDPASVTLGTTETLISTLNTTYGSGVTIWLIAKIQVDNTSTAATQVTALNIKQGATVLDSIPYTMRLWATGSSAPRSRFAIVQAKRVTAAANESFTANGTASAANVTAQARILAVLVDNIVAVDGASTAIGTGSTTITTVTTSIPSGTKVVAVASGFVQNTATSSQTIAANTWDLNGGGVSIDDNAYTIEVAKAGLDSEGDSLGTCGIRTTAGANESFTITAAASATGINGQSAVVVLYPSPSGFDPITVVSVLDPNNQQNVKMITSKKAGDLARDSTAWLEEKLIREAWVQWAGSWDIKIADSALGTEALAIQTQVPVSDSGLGSEAIDIQVQVPVSDSGSGSDAVSVSPSITISDSGTGSEALDIQTQVPVSDSAVGSEALSIQAQVPIVDSAVGTETLAITAQIPVTDSGLGSDLVAIQAQVPVSDSAVGTDAVSVNTAGGGVNINVSDSAAGTDLVDVIKQTIATIIKVLQKTFTLKV